MLPLSAMACRVPRYWAVVVGEFGGTECTAPNRLIDTDEIRAAVKDIPKVAMAPPLTLINVGSE